jgi:ATP-binding cassette subfamily F protein uup
LESLLQEYTGTLFLVSHDRAFLENTVTQVIAFEGNGILTEFGGGYDDWQRFTAQRLAEKTSTAKASTTSTPTTNTAASKNTTATKLNFKEQKELEALPAQIEQLEAEQTQVNQTLADPNFYRDHADDVKPLQLRLTQIEAEIETKMERWAVLDSKAN